MNDYAMFFFLIFSLIQLICFGNVHYFFTLGEVIFCGKKISISSVFRYHYLHLPEEKAYLSLPCQLMIVQKDNCCRLIESRGYKTSRSDFKIKKKPSEIHCIQTFDRGQGITQNITPSLS